MIVKPGDAVKKDDTLELTKLTDKIYFKRIWITSSIYQVGYEVTVPYEKLNDFITIDKIGNIYLLKNSHISINGERHPLEGIEGHYTTGYGRQRQLVTVVFKCEYKEANNK